MDVESLKKISDLAHNIAVEKQNALERLRTRQLLIYQNHIFRADAETINLANILLQNNKTTYILDSNNNPCRIDNIKDFLDKLIEKNQESLNAYHQIYESFKKR
jgi:aryl-alcohol dehydrogenase-like predicted oxidoreductase